jgi:glycine/D-amino acid oxidase-like deaminating enzyme
MSLDGVENATFGVTGEGWFDGWALMQAFRKKARSLGVLYVQGEVAGVEKADGRVAAIRLVDGHRIACGALVNAAGASGGRQLAEVAGVAIPVYAKKRCVFAFTCRGPVEGAPLLIDTSGVWCRPEGRRGPDGQMFICGGPPAGDDLPADDFDVEHALFEEVYWPTLAARVPAFEEIRPGRSWAGHYDMNLLDHNAIVGPAGSPNFYLANGFSGHGLQQSPAVGRALAELIVHGRFVSLDLSPMGYDRVPANRPLLERNVI